VSDPPPSRQISPQKRFFEFRFADFQWAFLVFTPACTPPDEIPFSNYLETKKFREIQNQNHQTAHSSLRSLCVSTMAEM
jgi:hypothetical protein